jgi:hypothetical protein
LELSPNVLLSELAIRKSKAVSATRPERFSGQSERESDVSAAVLVVYQKETVVARLGGVKISLVCSRVV